MTKQLSPLQKVVMYRFLVLGQAGQVMSPRAGSVPSRLLPRNAYQE